MSRINFVLTLVEHGKSFITAGPGGIITLKATAKKALNHLFSLRPTNNDVTKDDTLQI